MCCPTLCIESNYNFENPVLAVLNGRMRQNNIKVLLGDEVELEFSPYDLTRGRITRRH